MAFKCRVIKDSQIATTEQNWLAAQRRKLKRWVSLAIAPAFLISVGATGQEGAYAAPADESDGFVRTIVTTDPELDDLNSMLRMLLYSNEITIDGLVYSASTHHYMGDPDEGIEPHRWPAPGDKLHIDTAVDAYAEVYDNLKVHDPNYPSPSELREKIAVGNVKYEGDMSEDTEGSELIKEVLLEETDDVIHLQVWGGPNTVARALKSIEEQFADTEEWPVIKSHVSDKAIMTAFGQQDDTFTEYIRPNWPDIEFREVATSIWGYGARNVALPGTEKYLSAEWTRDNVSSVGPIGAEYRVWGDGKQMAEGFDDEDYFGLSGYDVEELEEMGYWVWMPPQEKDSWISEGDSSNFALILDNGLRSYEAPGFGGWGGRQAPLEDDPNSYSNRATADKNAEGDEPDDYSAARWFEAFQHDFAARLQWSVSDSFDEANHQPEPVVEEGLDLNRVPGEEVVLHGSAEDPDGDDVHLEWWQYEEAGTYDGIIDVRSDDGIASFSIPDDAQSGDTLHFILEATDDGVPNLTQYQRVVITVSEPIEDGDESDEDEESRPDDPDSEEGSSDDGETPAIPQPVEPTFTG